jgi:hypothetical protein
VRRDGEGHYVLPLWLLRDGEYRADLSLTLSPAEAEMLHAQLCRAPDGEPVPPDGPDCRRSVQTSRSLRAAAL